MIQKVSKVVSALVQNRSSSKSLSIILLHLEASVRVGTIKIRTRLMFLLSHAMSLLRESHGIRYQAPSHFSVCNIENWKEPEG